MSRQIQGSKSNQVFYFNHKPVIQFIRTELKKSGKKGKVVYSLNNNKGGGFDSKNKAIN